MGLYEKKICKYLREIRCKQQEDVVIVIHTVSYLHNSTYISILMQL